MNKKEKFSDFKKCFKLSKVKIGLLLVYLVIFIYIITRVEYKNYILGDMTCQMVGGCVPPYISYLNYIFNGVFLSTASIFNNFYLFIILVILFLLFMHIVNSFIHFSYIKLKEVLKNAK